MLARGAASTGQRRRRHSPLVERAEPAYRCHDGLHAAQPSTIAAATQAGAGERQEGADAERMRHESEAVHLAFARWRRYLRDADERQHGRADAVNLMWRVRHRLNLVVPWLEVV